MNEYADSIRNKLDIAVDRLNECSRSYVRNPEKDFIRKRKLDFKEMANILLSIGGNSLKDELFEHFSFDVNTATCSAFVQQRGKILPKAFEYLFHEFTSSALNANYYHGYRMLAVDGSRLCYAQNEKDVDAYVRASEKAKGYNLLHLNAMYDLCSRVYVDAIVQPIRKFNEYQALMDMVDRSEIGEPTIVIADRGYESFNVFEHIKQKEWKYVIRVKDRNSNSIASRLSPFDQETFDIECNTLLTRRQTTEVKEHPEKYSCINGSQKFDYLPVGDRGDYPMNFRIVRFAISENNYEVIITNLSKEDFPLERIKEIYNMRWGIETSFRELKHTIGLINFHTKKASHILQEIFARLTMYNFCEIITTHVVIEQKDRKYDYQVEFTTAVTVCLYYFRRRYVGAPNVEALILKNISPIRPGRKSPRKTKTKSSVSFIYRVA